MEEKHVVVIGAGPGGLTAAMILAHRGFRVTICEKKDRVGGRNAAFNLGPYIFDTGPTFLMMKFVLDEVFRKAGRTSKDYLDFVKLDPMYRLYIRGQQLNISSNHDKMRDELRRKLPDCVPGFDKILTKERERFKRLYPCLQKPYGKLSDMFSYNLRHALPVLQLSKTVGQVVESYFPDEAGQLAFIFQTKYLGMSAWQCPAAFMIVPFVEHEYGIYHVQGGLSEISAAMAKVAGEHGAALKLHAPVKKVIVHHKKATGVELETGEQISADAVVVNADFAQAMTTLFEPGTLKKYTRSKLEKKRYSCSTFMLYLGLDMPLPELAHHNVIFAEDYHASIREIFETGEMPKNISCYVRNSSITDPRVAPAGHSNIYVLMPVANLQLGQHDWAAAAPALRERIIDLIEQRTGVTDLRGHIRAEKIIHPGNWVSEYDVFFGATFNLAHNLTQMLYFRPHNRFEEVGNVYLAGGGTHPGSGLPTIYESGRIAADLITKDLGE